MQVTVAEDMGQHLRQQTMATRSGSAQEVAFVSVERNYVEPSTVDKAPVFKRDVQSSAVPSRAIGILIIRKAPSNLALVAESHQLITKAQLYQAMKEGCYSPGFNLLRVLFSDGNVSSLFGVVETNAKTATSLAEKQPQTGVSIIQMLSAEVRRQGQVGG